MQSPSASISATGRSCGGRSSQPSNHILLCRLARDPETGERPSRSATPRRRRTRRCNRRLTILAEQAAKLRAVGLRAACHFAEHLLASGLGQLAHLSVNALAVRRYPRVAVFHASLYGGNLCKGKALSDQWPDFFA